ncbi:hypothetical protein DEIPH_ctg032orf0107 [Deinococcus phoenicis]|uniref:DUF2314 domain-containing protein n=1 Tax=Deinococcus phoenicis TaxID=1476583 RepID=A0A016QPZ2_9DEIO|nr:hypothetical protein [Deinococcus phoenicis]EYB67854.1 hypothetical protein DEIPH_ctg032orf0107 [Deinococcus phoenicis]
MTTTKTDVFYTLRTLNVRQRHIIPGALVCLQVDDAFSPMLRSEVIWVRVQDCTDSGVYRGRVITDVEQFDELERGDDLYFRLEHVLFVQGEGVSA